MHTLVETFADAGHIALSLLVLGALGGLSAAIAALSAVLRARAALWLGVVATVLGALVAGAGGAEVLRGRAATNAVVAAQSPPPAQARRMRREGYSEARRAGKVGLLFAVLPLLAGVGATLAGARRRAVDAAPPPDPEIPFGPRTRLGAPTGATIAGLLAAGFALSALSAPVPGKQFGVDDTTRRVGRAIAELRGGADVETCNTLEWLLLDRDATLDPSLVPDLKQAARRCVEARIQSAAVRSPLLAVRRELEEVAASFLVRRDPELVKLVEENLEEVRQATVAMDGNPITTAMLAGWMLNAPSP